MRKWIAGIGTTLVLGAGTAGVAAVDAKIDPYTDKGTHFELPITSDIPQGERVEIAKDRAAMTLKGWNDEYAITIEPQIPSALPTKQPFTVPANRPLLSKKMEFKNGNTTAFIEPISSTTNEFDIDFTLSAKPDTNVFTYKISGAEDFDFFYQPALNTEPLEEGSVSCTETQCFDKDGNVTSERPDNVVGSYAVYSKSKANHKVGSTNYATGKIAHIFRPKATDANGDWVWATLDYANGVLSVIVPQDFLDGAAYPVRVDPTFGQTSIGGTARNNDTTDGVLVSWHAAPENGTITSISWYAATGLADDGPVKVAIWDKTAGGTLLTQSSEITVVTTASWNSGSISQSITSSNEYWIGTYHEEVSVPFDTSTGKGHTENLAYPGTTPADVDAAGIGDDRLWSYYATYTASGGGGAAPVDDTYFESIDE